MYCLVCSPLRFSPVPPLLVPSLLLPFPPLFAPFRCTLQHPFACFRHTFPRPLHLLPITNQTGLKTFTQLFTCVTLLMTTSSIPSDPLIFLQSGNFFHSILFLRLCIIQRLTSIIDIPIPLAARHQTTIRRTLLWIHSLVKVSLANKNSGERVQRDP